MPVLSPSNVFAPGRNPHKAEIIQLLNLLFGVSRGGWVVAHTLTALNAITPENETDGGVVLTSTGAGYYDRSGGAWVFGRGFPDTFARVTLSGTGTAQVGALKPGVVPANVEVFFAKVATPNTGPMTLSISGEEPRAVVNFVGNALSPGEWTGVVLFFLNGDGAYQLMIDAGAAASAAQSATLAGEQAAYAEEWAQSPDPISPEAGGDGSDHSAKYWAEQAGAIAVPPGSITESTLATPLLSRLEVAFDTVADAEAYNPSVVPAAIRTNGYGDPADGGGALYRYNANPAVEHLGPNIFKDGGFEDATKWILGTAWSIADGFAVANGSNASRIDQLFTLIPGRTYEISFTISDYVSGGVWWRLLNSVPSTLLTGTARTANGTWTERFVAPAGVARIGIALNSTATSLKVDDASIREVIDMSPAVITDAAGNGFDYASDEIKVEALGAVGDDSADCTAAFQAALVLQALTGKPVVVGPGTFRCGPISGLAPANIQGAGIEKTKVRFASAVDNACWLSFRGVNGSYSLFQDFQLLGAGRDVYNGQSGVRFGENVGTNRAVGFKRVWIESFNWYAVEISSSIKFLFEGGRIRSCGPRGNTGGSTPAQGGGILWYSDGSFASASTACIENVVRQTSFSACNIGVLVPDGNTSFYCTIDECDLQSNRVGVRDITSRAMRLVNSYFEYNDVAGAQLGDGVAIACRASATTNALNFAMQGSPIIGIAAPAFSTLHASLTDDTATSFAVPGNCTIIITSAITTGPNGSVWLRHVGGISSRIISMVSGSVAAVTTGALTGTTGADGTFTISVHSDGKAYLENRTGQSVSLTLLVVGEAVI